MKSETAIKARHAIGRWVDGWLGSRECQTNLSDSAGCPELFVLSFNGSLRHTKECAGQVDAAALRLVVWNVVGAGGAHVVGFTIARRKSTKRLHNTVDNHDCDTTETATETMVEIDNDQAIGNGEKLNICYPR